MSFFNNLSGLFNTTATKPGQKPKFSSPHQGKPTPQARPKFKTEPTVQPIRQQAPAPLPKPTPQPPMAIVKEAEDIIREARAKAREIIVEAKSETLTIRSSAEADARKVGQAIEEQQRNLDKKIDRIDFKLEQITGKEEALDTERERVNQAKDKVQKLKDQQVKELEKVAGLTKDEATQNLLSQLEKTMTQQMAQLIKQKEEEALASAEEKTREILIDAMLHGATDYVAEYTVSVITLPNEETKGKIIGKAGRNIHAFEKETGVDVDLDVSPTEVRISSYDPIRREVARISLERLIKDGRIQPARIEEVVAKAQTEIDKTVFEAGKQLCHSLDIYNLPIDLIKLVGKFKYRYSYGQNLIAHTLEETQIAIKLASEFGVDVHTVKLGCLLHDIGKVAEEDEGSHVELGVKIAKRFNLPQAVIDCIAQHHEDESFSGPEQMLVYIADAISGARPGARYENYDEYVKRLTQIEELASAYPEVKQAYAIQAGREVRVLLEPDQSKDDDVKVLSIKIRDQIKDKVTYPGTVTVTVMRETRAQEVAK
ncbi:MAG: ribonuclease Y [Patescibacteria group bacterium]